MVCFHSSCTEFFADRRGIAVPGLVGAHLIVGSCRSCQTRGHEEGDHETRASMLITSGADVKVVQARLQHASAETKLDTCSHLWPDSDDSTRAAIDAAMTAR